MYQLPNLTVMLYLLLWYTKMPLKNKTASSDSQIISMQGYQAPLHGDGLLLIDQHRYVLY